MRSIKKFILPALTTVALILGLAFNASPTKTYKCMVQMINYSGEGAYIVISLIDAEGNYEKTLYVQGDDEDWYHDISEWWRYFSKEQPNIDAITGATVGGGERSINLIEIEDAKIDAGYKIRFETAVEDKEYYAKDVEFPLTSEHVKLKHEGTGFIRYVRMIPSK